MTQLAGEIASASDEHFRHRSVSVWDSDQGFVLGEPGRVSGSADQAVSPR